MYIKKEDFIKEIYNSITDMDKIESMRQETDVIYGITEEDALEEHDLRYSELEIFREAGLKFWVFDTECIYDALNLCRHVDIYRKGKYPEDLYD